MVSRLIMFLLLCVAAAPALAATALDKELSYQVRFGQAANVEMLLRKGADANQINEADMPLVAVAASRGGEAGVAILRALVKLGKADINQGNANAQYPILIAARNCDAPVMDFLLNEAFARFDVQDLNGTTPRDVAQQAGCTEVAGMIEAIDEERANAKKHMRSPERRAQLMRDFLTASCRLNYMNYYYSTKQDPIPKETQEATLESLRGEFTVAMNDLVQVFSMDRASLLVLAGDVNKQIFQQLEEMISNRNRRAHGIGMPEDIQKRCGAIVDDASRQVRYPDATPEAGS